ncbi:MAG TPA: peptide-methionine (S)-S-oxide reductase MsrA [Gemmatimonadaceae bacterium]|nr:peptide-methionine (S)-S-oxide reductase MsrA [Gemmatimonadaceae bacterium]
MTRSAALVLSLLAVPVVLAAQTRGTTAVSRAAPARADTAVFAGGCFWGVEGVFEHLKGVTSATSGYAGGSTTAPSYEQVGSGGTGHAESVQVVFDPSQISYGQLMQVFFVVAHDPTQLNRQGPDVGPQYRSAIFYRNDQQKREAEAYVAQLRAAKVFTRPIVTQIAPLHGFYVAEAYHQNYMAQHPNAMYIVVNDAPKVEHLRKQFPALYRN